MSPKFREYCKFIVKTRINKYYESDTFFTHEDYAEFFISRTYSYNNEVAFDYMFIT